LAILIFHRKERKEGPKKAKLFSDDALILPKTTKILWVLAFLCGLGDLAVRLGRGSVQTIQRSHVPTS
jgi:hypothetical protein